VRPAFGAGAPAAWHAPCVEIAARARLVGIRIDTRELDGEQVVALAPPVLRVGDAGRAVIFRFGAVVGFDLDPEVERALLARLAPRVGTPLESSETEEAILEVAPDRPERVEAGGRVSIREASAARLQVVASVLAKSTVLAHYEQSVARIFDRVEVLAEKLRQGRGSTPARELVREIGDALLIQSRTVGHVEVSEKPEITWDDPALDRLYERLAVEYELRERDRALSRKLALVASTAQTYLDVVQSRQTIRVEWYIVILILVEIVLGLVDRFARA
jgi:required for meiotic nuclear division protein 1